MIDRRLIRLAGAIAVIGANSLALSPIAGAVAGSFPGEDAAGVMRAAAAYGLATAFSALVLAPLIDRIGQRVALVRALATLAVALAGAALAPTLPVFDLAQALAGLAAGCALPAVYALSAQVAPEGRGNETLGVVLVGWTVSLVVGGSASALVADAVHWRLVFGALSLAAGWAALGLRRDEGWPRRPLRVAAGMPLGALRLPGIALSLLWVATYMTAFYGLYTYLGPHLTEHLGWSTASAGLAPVAYGLGFGAAAFADRLLDRWAAAVAAPFVFLGLGLVYVALAQAAADGWALIALCLAWGLANHVGVNLIISRLIALAPARSGAVMGLYSTVTYLAVFAGAALYQPLFRSAGFAWCARVSAGLVAVALAVAILQQRAEKPWRRARAGGGLDRPASAQGRESTMATTVLFVQGAGAGAYACDRELACGLQRELGDTYRVCYPRMPDEATPRYAAWRAALLDAIAASGDGCVLVGHSVGGTVLVHVLAEEGLAWRPGGLGLIAPPFIGPGGWSSDDIAPFPGAARLPVGLPVFLHHGTHDQAVPPTHARLYAEAMPRATVRMLPCRDHQLDNDLSELARDIASLDSPGRR